MIPKPQIAKWQIQAPWKEFAQVEQDLILSRLLVEIFSDTFCESTLHLGAVQHYINCISSQLPVIRKT